MTQDWCCPYNFLLLAIRPTGFYFVPCSDGFPVFCAHSERLWDYFSLSFVMSTEKRLDVKIGVTP